MKNEFKVIPNLSIRGEELKKRIANRTIILNGTGGNYSLEEAYDNVRRMNKIDIQLAARQNKKFISETSKKLQNG